MACTVGQDEINVSFFLETTCIFFILRELTLYLPQIYWSLIAPNCSNQVLSKHSISLYYVFKMIIVFVPFTRHSTYYLMVDVRWVTRRSRLHMVKWSDFGVRHDSYELSTMWDHLLICMRESGLSYRLNKLYNKPCFV